MTIDITAIAWMVRRMDVSATLKSFIVVIAFFLVLAKLIISFASVLVFVQWDFLDSEESGMFIAVLLTAVVSSFSPLAFIFWDWMARQPWRHLAAIVGALLGTIGMTIVGALIGILGGAIIDDTDPTALREKILIGMAVGLVLASAILWLISESRRVRLLLQWLYGLVFAAILVMFIYFAFEESGYGNSNGLDPDFTDDPLDLLPLAFLPLLVWLFIRTIRHRIILSGDRPRELFLGALHRKGFWVRLAFLSGLPSSLWHIRAMKTLAFWAFLLARPLVYAGLWILLISSDESLDSITWLAIGIASIVGGHLLFYAGKRLAARYIWLPRNPGDSRDPVLFLRSFENDQLDFKRSWWHFFGHWIDLWSFRRNADEAMIDEIAQYGPVVALGMPGEEKIPYGAARYYATHENWQKIVTDTAISAQAVILGAGDTPGVVWEYDLLASEELLEGTLLLFPPTTGGDSASAAALSAFTDAVGWRNEFEIAEGQHPIALLHTDAGPTLLTAREATAAAYVVAVRAHFQKCTSIQLADSLSL